MVQRAIQGVAVQRALIGPVDARRQRALVAEVEVVLSAEAPLPLGRIGRDHSWQDAGVRRQAGGDVGKVQIADRTVHFETGDRVDFGLRLGPFDVRVAAVDRQGAGAGADRRTAQQRDLDGLIPVVEGRNVQSHAAVEPLALEAHFVGIERFRTEGKHLLDVERPRVDAAALEARRELRVGHEVGSPLVVQICPVIDVRPGVLADVAVERAQHGVGRPVSVVARVQVGLVLFGVADASGQVKLGGDVPGGLGEHGLAVGDDRVIAQEVERDPGVPEILVGGVGGVFPQVEAAQGVFQDVVEQPAVQPEFLGELPVRQVFQAQTEGQRRRVVVLGKVADIAAIGADGFQRETLGQLPVDRARHAPAFVETGVRRGQGIRVERRAQRARRHGEAGVGDEGIGRDELAAIADPVHRGEAAIVDRRRVDQSRRRVFGVVVGVVADQVDLEIVRGQPAERRPKRTVGLAAFVTEHAVGAGRHVRQTRTWIGAGVVQPRDVAVIVIGDRGQAHEQLVRNQGEVDAAARLQTIEAAVGALQIAAAVAGGLLGVQLDRAADGVLAGQGALRTAENLHPVQVQEVEDRSGQRGIVDVVHVETDARLQRRVEVVLADAADRGAQRRTEGRALGLQGHVGGLVGHLLDAGLPALLQHLGVDRGDGDRRLLHVLRTELGGDDHLADGIGAVVLIGRRRGRGAGDQDAGERQN